MGNSPLTVCIHQAWEKQTVQVVLPDGQVLFLPHPLTASMLMKAHPYHFVCQGSPSLLEQRLPMDAKLETGELYYLLPVPPSDFQIPKAPPPSAPPPGGGHYGGGGSLVMTNPMEKLSTCNTEPLVADKSGSFSRLKMGPQQCLINLLVFRQSVASVMPEETLKGASQALPTTQGGAILGGEQAVITNCAPAVAAATNKCVTGDNYQPHISTLLASRNQLPRLEPRHHRASRGRNSKQGLAWKPQLATILENRPWHDLAAMHRMNDISVSVLSSIRALTSSAPPPAPPAPITSTPSSPIHSSSISSSPNTPPPTLRLFQELARPDRPSPSLSQISQTSPRVCSSPSRISSSPSRVPSSPSRTASLPSQIPCSPSRVPSSPSRVPSSPSRVPSSPSRVPSSPSRTLNSLIVGSPTLYPTSPARVPNSPMRPLNSPARASSSPKQFPSSPARVPNSLVHFPSSPARVPNSPVQFPSSPARIPSSPMHHVPSTRFPPSPLQFLGSPSAFPSPLQSACSPSQRPASPSLRNFQRQRFVYSA